MFRSLAALLAGTVLAACSGGHSRNGLPGTGGDFFVLSTNPPNNGRVFLNDSIAITLSTEPDLATADFNAISIAVFDQNGTPLQEQPRGTFSVEVAAGDADETRRELRFNPVFPTDDTFSNGGLKAARRYLFQLAQGDPRNAVVLRDKAGRALRVPYTLTFETVTGDSASQLFRDVRVGGPQVIGVDVTPMENGAALLGKKGERPTEVRVHFDQPLNPASTNVPTRLDPGPDVTDPRLIDRTTKGRVFLEYDDPEYGRDAWLPAFVAIESNSNRGCTLALTPTGVLPNNADVRVIVEPTLEDLSGQSNRDRVDARRVAATFRTEAAREPQFDAVVETFDSLAQVDLEPTFLEPLAEVGAGSVRAAFAFEGGETVFDYRPNTREVVLNTDFTQISPQNGAPFNVSGGVFQFRNVTIPTGVRVLGTGSKPMVWLVTGDFVVEGELSVQGGDGTRVDSLNSANVPTPGGIASCGGGNGGRGSPRANETDDRGEAGFGPFQTPGGGGSGGQHACRLGATCGRGGGGGGGSFATQGDPHHSLIWLATPPALPLVGRGRGGRMCDPARTGTQADAGPLGFVDGRPANDFWGATVDLSRRVRITGELLGPRGGSGGGGGGDANNFGEPVRCAPNPTFLSDRKGGGGGAGGGVLIVKALGRIVVKRSGIVTANGGHGGGGEMTGSNDFGGGGGGGAGGMIVLMSGSGIHLVTHGLAYADSTLSLVGNGSYDFVLSADGGIGLRGSGFGALNTISGKYPSQGGPTTNGVWDFNPVGGFGGLGVVQLMAPPGDNRPQAEGGDGTGTRLDDGVFFYASDARLAQGLSSPDPHASGSAMTGEEKMRYLGWRGFPDERGVGRDDDGDIVLLPQDQHGEGDIRPAPVLLPAPFGAVSRLRSRWIATGATARLADSGNDATPRTLVERADPADPLNPFTNLRAGPTYAFSGTFHGANEPSGYVRYRQTTLGVERAIASVLASPAAVRSVESNGVWRGLPCYVLRLDARSAALGQIRDRFTGYRAQLRSALNTALGSYRILAHTDSEICLSPDAGPLPDEPVATVDVLAELFGYRSGDVLGMGSTFTEVGPTGTRTVPLTNVRIGFAFHVNPAAPSSANATLRLPADPNEFLHDLDLERPDVVRRVRALGKTNGGTAGAVAVQYDVLFNTAFSEISAGHVDARRTLSPATPRPAIDFLVLPFQF